MYRLLTVLLLFTLFTLTGWSITIKLASPLPEGSEPSKALSKLASDWKKISNGEVRLKIYPNNVAGNEGDVVRKMRFGQINGGIFSAFGLKSMVPETFVLTLPGMIRDDRELDYILENWSQRFDLRFEAEGFEMAGWTKTGWAYIFGKEPLKKPADLKNHVLAVDNTEVDLTTVFKALDFQAIPVSITETLVALQSGMAEAFFAPPLVSAALQLFAMTPYMTDYRLAPVIVSVVFSKRSWDSISQEYRADLKAAVVEMCHTFQRNAIQLNDKALQVMKDNGLQEVRLNSNEIDLWETQMLKGHALMVGENKPIPVKLYNELKSTLIQLRNL